MTELHSILRLFPEGVCLECRGCCVFDEHDADLAPRFTVPEAEQIGRAGGGSALLKASADEHKQCCEFLSKDSHKCMIYAMRPLDCWLWPFVIAWDAEERNVCLWLANDSWCPLSGSLTEDRIVESVLAELTNRNVIGEINSGVRYVWPWRQEYIYVATLDRL